MAISSIEAIPVQMDVKPLDEEYGLAPYRSNHDSVESRDRLLVRVDTDDGVTGWGEMLVAMESPTASKAIVEDVVAPKLLGREVSEIRALVDDFYFPYTRIQPFLGAVEMALWDAHGKLLDASVAELLGGAMMDNIPVAFCLGILNPEASGEHAAFANEAGFDVLKTKAGPDWQTDIERIRAMDAAADGELEFRLDPNQGWTFEEAIRAVAALEDAGIFLQYIEQPCRIDTYGTYSKLRSRTRTPIAVNEDTYFERNLSHLLREDAIDVAAIDLVPAGGILAAREQAAIAGNQGVSVTHHCGFDLGVKTAAVLQMVAATPAINLAPDTVYYAWEDDILKTPLDVVDGAISVPKGPGLGVTVDEAKVQRYRTDG